MKIYQRLLSTNSTSIQDGRTPLHWACTSGTLEIVRYLLDQNAEVDVRDSSGWTPLHIAGLVPLIFSASSAVLIVDHPASAGHEEIVRELLGAGADVNRTNDKGLTPL